MLIAQGRILVDGSPAYSIQQRVGEFTHVELDGVILQDNAPVYIMMNKPKGVVSATLDTKNTTVVDLITHPLKKALHIAGRLDFNTTGLILLTNDGAWSRRISLPESKLEKTYSVFLSKDVTDEYVHVFEKGIYLKYENITTQPAKLEILSERHVLLSITEGKYHQVKRMFGYFQNEVLELHRLSIGGLKLDDALKTGEYRQLNLDEIEVLT